MATSRSNSSRRCASSRTMLSIDDGAAARKFGRRQDFRHAQQHGGYLRSGGSHKRRAAPGRGRIADRGIRIARRGVVVPAVRVFAHQFDAGQHFMLHAAKVLAGVEVGLAGECVFNAAAAQPPTGRGRSLLYAPRCAVWCRCAVLYQLFGHHGYCLRHVAQQLRRLAYRGPDALVAGVFLALRVDVDGWQRRGFGLGSRACRRRLSSGCPIPRAISCGRGEAACWCSPG